MQNDSVVIDVSHGAKAWKGSCGQRGDIMAIIVALGDILGIFNRTYRKRSVIFSVWNSSGIMASGSLGASLTTKINNNGQWE